MVADFFELEGWDTYFLGANTPPESIRHAVEEHRADVLAVSVTMTFHVSHVSALIDDLRKQPGTQKTRVLMGGYSFNLSPQLWKKVGADGYAIDAYKALLEANRVLIA
jgi:methanogenic corrinoid protein MtbC1